MTNRAHDAYLTERILSADPVELVRMLYAGASQAVEIARARLAARDIRGRSSAVTKALRILFELGRTLDRERAPGFSRNLAALYDYMERRLIEANIRQTDPPLAEVEGLLRTLAEGWRGVCDAPVVAEPVAAARPAPRAKVTLAAWSPPAHVGEPEPAHNWSF